MSGRDCRSLRLDARELDHLGPLLGFVGDELAEVGWRTGKHCAAKVGKPRLHPSVGESGIDLLVELVDYLGSRVLGCTKTGPLTRFVARYKFRHSRNLGQVVETR